MTGRPDALSAGTVAAAGRGGGGGDGGGSSSSTSNDDIYGGDVYPGVLPAVPDDAVPVIPDKDHRTNAATAASAASVRALSAQALQYYFRAPVKAFFRTRVDYLAYARAPDGTLSASALASASGAPSSAAAATTTTTTTRPSSSSPAASHQRLRSWLRSTTPGVLTVAIRRYGWSVVPDQVLPPLVANIGVASVLYSSYLQILGRLHPDSAQARKRVYPPPTPVETFVAGFLAGGIQSVVAAPLDAIQARYDHGAGPVGSPNGVNGAVNGTVARPPQSMWAFSIAKLREIGLRGIFTGWGLSFVKDSFGSGIFFSVFEYVQAQGYHRFVTYYYGALDESMVRAQQQRQEAAARRRQQRQDWVHSKVEIVEATVEAQVEAAKVEAAKIAPPPPSWDSNDPNHPQHRHRHRYRHHLHHLHEDSGSGSGSGSGSDAGFAAAAAAADPAPAPTLTPTPAPIPALDGPPGPIVIRPHYAMEPTFLLLAGLSASLAQQVLLHPLTHLQVVQWDMLEDLDAKAKAEREAAAARAAAAAAGRGTGAGGQGLHGRRSAVRSLLDGPRLHLMKTYYRAYVQTWARCAELAAAEGRSRMSWLYRGFWWNAIRQVPSTSAGLVIFELLRRKYGMAGEAVRISQDGYDIVLR